MASGTLLTGPPKGRKRHQTDDMASQASLSSFFASAPPPGTPAPPRFAPSQPTQHQEEELQGPLSAFATDDDYTRPYVPRLDYLEPSIVPQETHNKMDMNYVSWAIRHAITTRLTPLQAAQETFRKDQKDLTELVQLLVCKMNTLASSDLITRTSIDDINKNLVQSLHHLLMKTEEAQGKIAEQIKEVKEQTLLILNKPTPPPHPATPIIRTYNGAILTGWHESMLTRARYMLRVIGRSQCPVTYKYLHFMDRLVESLGMEELD